MIDISIKTWDDIKKYIKWDLQNMAQNEFIILEYKNNIFKLLSDHDINNLPSNTRYKSYILPWYCLDNILYYVKQYYKKGFDTLPKYYIINTLYQYRNNENIYKLLWFTNATYHIVKNNLYYFWEENRNYNKEFIENVLKHFLQICEKEIYTLTKINHREIYRQTQINFSPIEPLYRYGHLYTCLDASDINVIIDYIVLLIRQIRINYRFVTIYI